MDEASNDFEGALLTGLLITVGICSAATIYGNYRDSQRKETEIQKPVVVSQFEPQYKLPSVIRQEKK